ncbi:MAG: hypothetical protein JXQ96_04875, partial [Cyclobacteriaceae bacterium]
TSIEFNWMHSLENIAKVRAKTNSSAIVSVLNEASASGLSPKARSSSLEGLFLFILWPVLLEYKEI